MKKFMSWLENSFAPKVNQVVENPWVSAVSSALMKVLPFILVGSIGFLYNVLKSFWPSLPDISHFINFSFGMLSLFLAFLVAYQAMEKLGHQRFQISSGLTSISVFIMMIFPLFDNEGHITILFERLGPTGMLIGFISGLFVSIIFNIFGKFQLLSENDTLPDFIKEWINQIIPISLTLIVSMLLTFIMGLDIFGIVMWVFSPLISFGQTLPGLILLVFLPTFFYSLGISSWLFNPIQQTVFMAGIAANIAAVAAGGEPTNIVTSETVYTAALMMMGGTGATLTLNILMIFSKSKQLKTLGRVTIIPSFFNINEPLLFGAPIVLNPLLMVPMWINGIMGPVIVWFAMDWGLLNIPAKMIQIAQIPAPISSVMVTEDLFAIVVYIILFILFMLIWYPFFKIYEKQLLEEEKTAIK